ncbi:right-handed parallel beta-helix repeat-containing protein [Methanococcoides sp. LMO-2]|uniref:NosD domain-containing protein n=1 Tax=Methanococcoides cohabitans TaxID=3136559 RepID=A0ABU9KUG1_9EURY
MQVKSHHIFYIVMAIGFLTMVSGSAAADTINVDDSGSANYTTIQAAIDAANNGDTVLVYPGIYIENVDVNKELTITSLSGNPNDTVVQAADQTKHVFNVTSNNVTIEGFEITGELWKQGIHRLGICLCGVEWCNINNNSLSGNRRGILLTTSSSNNIVFNNSILFSDSGILCGGNNNIIKNNLALENGVGINVRGSHNNITSNVASNNFIGVMVIDCNNNTISSNVVERNNGRHGIEISFATNILLYNNSLKSNKNEGICLDFSDNNTIEKNNISFSGTDGVFLLISNYNVLNNNTIMNNSNHGIALKDCDNTILSNNNVNSNNGDGIHIWEKGSEIDYDAIFAWGGSIGNILIDNIVSKNAGYGIYIGNFSVNNTLDNNTVDSNGKDDIHITDLENNIIDTPSQKVPYPGLILIIVVFLVAYLCRRNSSK